MPSSVTHVPDRAPTFDPTTGRWFWWSTPGESSSLAQDQARAEEVTIEWTLDGNDPERLWVGVLPTLPGFAQFLWNISHGFLWLRRPEGVWKARLPNHRRRDLLSVHEKAEVCEQMPIGLRWGIRCLPTAPVSGWHNNGMDTLITLEDKDQALRGALWGERPVLINETLQPGYTRRKGDHRIIMGLWSRPGLCRFALGDVPVHQDAPREPALIITLPNGVHVAHPLAHGMAGVALAQGNLSLDIGGENWMPLIVQHVVIDDVQTTS